MTDEMTSAQAELDQVAVKLRELYAGPCGDVRKLTGYVCILAYGHNSTHVHLPPSLGVITRAPDNST